jgi:hypothetical protein
MHKPTIVFTMLFAACLSCFGQGAPAQATYPRIVKRIQLLNQTKAISPMTIYTPKDWGMFRVSVVMVETIAGQAGTWQALMQFTDGAGTDSPGLDIGLDATQTGRAWGDILFRDEAGMPIKFWVIGPADGTGGQYNVFIVVERLM